MKLVEAIVPALIGAAVVAIPGTIAASVTFGTLEARVGTLEKDVAALRTQPALKDDPIRQRCAAIAQQLAQGSTMAAEDAANSIGCARISEH